eukprot:TRINITY_DN12467_c0_g1_i4.p1 TRINITY_DN12467_c0_g1~~TRINITY_DN12467_c0_g1_i4.p1  ORF type:complete len:320 (+),score=76.99 TRINITY_DN12467_c0_g1_i4:137-961(+)
MECEERDREEMMKNFINCTGEHKNEYKQMMALENVDIEEVTCKLVNSLVTTCGELWNLCHSVEEVKRMKDMQVKEMITRNSDSGIDIEQCLTVAQYRESLIHKEPEALCVEEEELDIRIQFQICSHNTSTQLYEDVQDMEIGENALDTVCEGLKDLSEACFGYLLECFLVEDLMEMKKLHFEEVINFLLKFADGKITEDNVYECDAVKEIMDDIASIDKMDEEILRFKAVPKIVERGATNDATSMLIHQIMRLVVIVVLIICNDTDLPSYFLRL